VLLDRRLQLFVLLASLFVTCLLVGDIIGGKLLQLTVGEQAFVISAGMIPFPITFLLTDLLNEFYGKRAARFVTWVGFGMALLAFTLIGVAVEVPFAPFTHEASWQGVTQGAFDNVFAGSKRILFASMVAYLLSQFSDIALFNVLKRRTRGRLLWLRATGSTVVSQLLDTVTVQVIAWWGLLSVPQIGALVLTSYAVKLVVAVGLTPLIYAGHALLERQLGMHPVPLDAEGEVVAD
jgi:queuosine precursor transporter